MNNTGGNGLTVTGVSTTAGSGGTIQNKTSNGVELVNAAQVSLSNMNLTGNGQSQTATALACGNPTVPPIDPAVCVANLFMNTVSAVSLTNLSVSGSGQMGIAGKAVSGLSLVNLTINNNGNELYENGLFFKDLSGTVAITGTTVKDNFTRQADIENYVGTMNLAVTTSLFGRVSTTPDVNSNQGLFILLANAAHGNVDVATSSIVKNGNGNGLQINTQDSASLGSSGVHSSMHDMTSLSYNAAHVFVNTAGSAVAYFDTLNNSSMTLAGLQSIDYFAPGGSLTGIVQGNTIGTSGVANSACNPAVTGGGCNGMDIDQTTAGALSVRVQSNTIQQFMTNGISTGAVRHRLGQRLDYLEYLPAAVGRRQSGQCDPGRRRGDGRGGLGLRECPGQHHHRHGYERLRCQRLGCRVLLQHQERYRHSRAWLWRRRH